MATLKLETMILLPSRGMRAVADSAHAAPFFVSLHSALAVAGGGVAMASLRLPGAPLSGHQLRVLDSIHEDGAKLIEISKDALSTLRATQPGVRVVPLRYYTTQDYRARAESSPRTAAGAGRLATVTLSLISGADGLPVSDVTVVAFTDFAARQGAQGVTNSQGRVRLRLPSRARLERLYAYPSRGHWSLLKRRVRVTGAMQIRLLPIDLGASDGLRHFYGNAAPATGSGVRVGVIDTGVGPHADLLLEGGANTVVGEASRDFQDNGVGHGTHVAGIIAARGTQPRGVRGLAPGASLRSYRVFGKGQPGASNYSIAKALDQAAADACDLVNLSLGGPADPAALSRDDEAVRTALEDAFAAGVLAIAAAGNDGRKPVSFPAFDSTCVAVSALGRKGTFPGSATDAGEVAPPPGTDRKNFIAAFSNIGPEIDVTAPGVGIISSVPGGYAVMSGTSMAAPAVTGFAARLLAGNATLRGMPRGSARAAAFSRALAQAARSLGFGPRYEGQGMPQ
jgi:subtilisin